MKRDTILLLLSCAIGFTFLGFGIGRSVYKRPPVQTRDTIFSSDIIYIPRPEPIDIYIPEPPARIDTAAIIQDYLTAKAYRDTLISNREITAILRDTVYQNSIVGRTFSYTLSTPVIQCQRRPLSLFLTADSRLSMSLVATRDRWLIQGGYDFRLKSPFMAVGLRLY